MIEGESDFVAEEDMMRAIEVGHSAVRDLCLGELSAFLNFLLISRALILTAATVSASRLPASFLYSAVCFASLVPAVFKFSLKLTWPYHLRRCPRTNSPSFCR